MLALLCFALAYAEVNVLTADNFESSLAGKSALVEFYAPWCGHCKRLLPEFEKASETLGDSAFLGKVDCTVEKSLASKFKIQGYPTVYWFVNGVQKEEYDGGRSANDISSWVTSKLSSPDL